MRIQLLGQGFESVSNFSVGNSLVKLFSDSTLHTFTAISAFTSELGINTLIKIIKNAQDHLRSVTLVTGVDQKGTSKEALELLLEFSLSDLKLEKHAFVFYAPPPFPIFHPKVYLFEGEGCSTLIIGSSNLTSPGLFNNIEASLLVQIDNSSKEDRQVLEQLKTYFQGIFNKTDPNLKKITREIIDDLEKARVVPTESERHENQGKTESSDSEGAIDFIYSIFPKRAIAKVPKEFRSKEGKKILRQSKLKTKNPANYKTNTILLWESGPLTERDLTIPKGKNTHQTGSMFFKKGLLKGIDQRHYFRTVIFSDLKWSFDNKPNLKHIERTIAKFRLVILGKDLGEYDLSLKHNTNTQSKTYLQNNCMTSLVWGEARPLIATDDLIGLNAQLFKIESRPGEFILEIS